jgi:uncharacterized membrane protein
MIEAKHSMTYRSQSQWLTWLCQFQGVYFFLTGLWPLIHIDSFVRVTGPKYDIWLVKTVGILILVIGGVLFSAARHRRINQETFSLAVGGAAGLAAIDIYYVAIDRIREVYLLDALAEIILIILWIVFWVKQSSVTDRRSTV